MTHLARAMISVLACCDGAFFGDFRCNQYGCCGPFHDLTGLDMSGKTDYKANNLLVVLAFNKKLNTTNIVKARADEMVSKFM